MFLARLMFGPVVLGGALFAAGCDNTLSLPPATAPNIIDTVTLSALQGTDISDPSGFDIITGRPTRTDRQSQAFDIAFDIDGADRSLILTTGALGLTQEVGIQMSEDAFEDITIAPLEDYDLAGTLAVNVGSVFIVRSRPVSTGCPIFLGFGALPRYGKFQVLSIDLETRQIDLQHIVNTNCGYRSLEPGVPIR